MNQKLTRQKFFVTLFQAVAAAGRIGPLAGVKASEGVPELVG